MVKPDSLIVGCLIGSMLVAPGCTKKYVAKVAPFERGKDEYLLKSAPHSGMYHVQFVQDDDYIKDAGAAPAVYLRKGDPCGFREDEDGRLIAIAGAKEIEVVGSPSQATHVMWYHKSKQPTQLARNMSKTGEVLQQVMIAGAVGAGVVGAGALWIWSISEDRDCDDYGQRSSKRKHKRR